MNPFAHAAQESNSMLCVGLDTEMDRIRNLPLDPANDPQAEFNRAIVQATQDLVCAYKPNLAFYESRGAAGWSALEETLALIPPEVPVILDAKRGDIGNTARLYARALFEQLGGAAVTVNPLMGSDSVQPFLDYTDRITFLLCHTSNPGAEDLQLHGETKPLYIRIAELARDWNRHANVGLVVGATYPDRLKIVRDIVGPDMPILCPGVGSQGAEIEAMLKAGAGSGPGALIVNASRSVLYASSGPDFAEAARAEAVRLREVLCIQGRFPHT